MADINVSSLFRPWRWSLFLLTFDQDATDQRSRLLDLPPELQLRIFELDTQQIREVTVGQHFVAE